MKTNNRIHLKGGKQSPVSQAAISADKPSAEHQSHQKKPAISLCLISTTDQSHISSIKLTAEDCDFIQAQIGKGNLSLAVWMREMFTDAKDFTEGKEFYGLKSSEVKLVWFDFGKLTELDSAIDQADALVALLQHQIENPGDCVYADQIQCGIVELWGNSFNRLRQVAEVLRNAHVAHLAGRSQESAA